MSTPSNVLPLPRWTLIIHAVQFVLAIIILGLDAYGIHYIAFNALIFSLVTALLTMGIIIYIAGTTLFLNKLYNGYIVAGVHLLMIIFWVTDLGLVANLARLFSGDGYSGYGYSAFYGGFGLGSYPCDECDDLIKRNMHSFAKRDSTSLDSYYGALAAGAFFGAMEFATWVVSLAFVAMSLNKQRQAHGTAAPPAYGGNQAGVPLEHKYGSQLESQPQALHPQAQPQGQFVQQPTYPQQQQFSQYQDPISRDQTVSPVSTAAGYTGPPPQSAHPTASEVSATSNGFNPHASELPEKR